MTNLQGSAEDERIFSADRGRDLKVCAEHRVQSPGKLTGRAEGNGRIAGGDDAERERAVLLRNLQGQRGISQPTFRSSFGSKISGRFEETQSKKDDRSTQAHSCYLRAVSRLLCP